VGFLGNYCEVCDCCWSKPCKNGGTCVNTNGVCSCTCATGYAPPACDYNYCSPPTKKLAEISTEPPKEILKKTTRKYFDHMGKSVTAQPEIDFSEDDQEAFNEAPGSYEGSPFTFRGRPHSVLYQKKKPFN
jgi:hypothetical protein